MNDPIRKLFGKLPAELRADLDAAYQACGVERLGELLGHGGRPPESCGVCGVPRYRWQDAVIEEMIPDGAEVLDLGCGRGDLLGKLIRDKGVVGQGVEMDYEAVLACIQSSIPVFQANLDDGLSGFPDGNYDFVILEETVQTLHKPLQVLKEMLRVGRKGIVSFPNFGCWTVRLELALRGRMPVTLELPHHWYDTPNIHLLTLRDFYSWADKHGVRITGGKAFANNGVRSLDYPADNLLAEEVLLAIEPAGADDSGGI